jgi:hypothetical protein
MLKILETIPNTSHHEPLLDLCLTLDSFLTSFVKYFKKKTFFIIEFKPFFNASFQTI